MSIITNKNWIFFTIGLIFPIHLAWGWQPTVRDSMTMDAIQARLKPIGEVEVEGEKPVEEALTKVLGPEDGKKRYETSCAVCHGTGVAGAPRFRNAADWQPRVAKGMDSMLQIALQGKGGMPPKGTCMSCSDEELRLAIKHMIPQ